ncbi:MAG: isoprenyl transferase [Bacteroides sp.]|nr:isoprenyl transferase [Ruminococcus flavefaciens]MCM1555735.1 isoprenyl transferase [Bacteroides sp.]
MSFFQAIQPGRVPAHVAIIMDGNGRWAQARGLDRSQGHIEGVKSVRRITEAACRIGVRYLTLYAFSTENWNRPKEEVNALMGLLVSCLHNEMPLFMDNGIRLRVIGDVDSFSPEVREAMEQALRQTEGNTRMDLVLALGYSSRWEITEAARKMAARVKEGTLRVEDIDAGKVGEFLSTSFMPDPDLLIRTGGESRVSNFLLWQIAYAEMYFSPVFWPDFSEEMFYESIVDFQNRERRFGKVPAKPAGA